MWEKYVSKKWGIPYWFNPYTGESVWINPNGDQDDEPVIQSEQKKEGSSDPLLASLDSESYKAFDLLNSVGMAACLNDDIVSFRSYLEPLLIKLSEGEDTLVESPGVHRFPPGLTTAFRYVVHDMAEEYELECASFGLKDHRHLVVWRPGCEPPEKILEDKEQAEIEAEAEARRQYEEELAKLAPQPTLSVTGKKRSNDLTADELANLHAFEVVPTAQKRTDRRTITEIQDEIINARRQRELDAKTAVEPT